MAWVRVESSVSRNRKFVKAGPGPSWLWLCGLAYCQEGLTDGFIPTEALSFLGVRNAPAMARRLVSANLWHLEEGGWRVHDYLDHNKPASEVRRINEDRRNGGKLGGRPNLEGKPSSKPSDDHKANLTENPSVRTAVHEAVPTAKAVRTADVLPALPMDVWFRKLIEVYPEKAVSNGHMTEQAFFTAVTSANTPELTFTTMIDNLANQKLGAQWSKGMIPKLEKWLREGLWQQRHEPATHGGTNAKTAGNVEALRRFVAKGQPLD